MDSNKHITVEEVDAALEAHEKNFKAVDRSKMNDAQLKAFDLCNILQKVKPVLKFVRGLLFFKHKWQLAIDDLVAAGDAACPVV